MAVLGGVAVMVFPPNILSFFIILTHSQDSCDSAKYSYGSKAGCNSKEDASQQGSKVCSSLLPSLPP